jgi:hypothetical protein
VSRKDCLRWSATLDTHTEDLIRERSPTTITRDPSPQPRFTSTSIRRNEATPIWEKQKNTAGRNCNQGGSASNCFRTFHSLRGPLTRYKRSHHGKRSLLHLQIWPRELQATVCLCAELQRPAPSGITQGVSVTSCEHKLGRAIQVAQSPFHINGL